jgi:hypothetical protein
VLESEGQKKALGWLTFLMIGVLIAVIGGGIVFRDKLFPSADHPAVESRSGSALVAPAVEDLGANKPAEAAALLSAAAANRPGQPWLNWTDLLLGLAQYASGHRSEAVDAFQRIQSRGPFSKDAADQPLARFFVETARQMTNEHPIDSKIPAGSGSSFEPVAFLLYGVKDWEIGDVDEAAALFRRFRQADFVGADAWLDGLKPFATNYVEEYTSYQMASDRWKAAKTLDQKRAAVTAFQAVQGKLAPRAKELAAQAAADVKKMEQERAQMLAQGKVPDGRYKLINRKTNKTIDVEAHSHDDGHKVQEFAWNGAGNQQWNITSQGNGYYLLVGVESGKALNVPKGQTDDGVALQQANVNKGISQKWKIDKVPNVPGNFFTLTAMCSGKVLAVASDANGSAIIQTTPTNAPEQQWKIEGL